ITQKLPFSKKKLPVKVILSYLFDYVIILHMIPSKSHATSYPNRLHADIATTSILIAAFTAIDAVEPFHQEFSLRNYTLQYKYAVHERIPVPELVVLVCFVPAVVIAIYTLVIDGIFSHQPSVPGSGFRRKLAGRYRFKDRLWELNCGILGLFLSVGAAFTVTGALKNAIGKPRPDLIDRCQPNVMQDPTPWGLVNHTVCTQTDNHILKDGFRSFPSGHSSTAFAGLFYLSIYLAAKLHVLDSKGEVWKSFIVIIPSLGASLIAGSRIMDARHHPFDVLSGSALGMLVAWGSYRQYFPPVSETWRKGRAYPIRAWGKEPQAPPADLRPDESIEPLRRAPAPMDVEARDGAYSTSRVTPEEHGGNVFRQQISETQRRREGSGLGSSEANLPPTNPFSSRNQGTTLNDGYWESSSEEEESYELNPQYTLT
ncbi:PAP2-domain-containing protein, partial [Patellaria atrata CBS 101060]